MKHYVNVLWGKSNMKMFATFAVRSITVTTAQLTISVANALKHLFVTQLQELAAALIKPMKS